MVRKADPLRYNLDSVARVAAVLEALEGSSGSGLDEVALRSGLSESTTLRYLSSLSLHGLVERDTTTGLYRLGLALFRLGQATIRHRGVMDVARAALEGLRDHFEETVNLASIQQGQVLIVLSVESTRSVRKGTDVGGMDPWHATSLGKALLAEMPEPDRERLIVDLPLRRFTPNTLTDVAELQRDLVQVRARGYAIDDEESVEGVRCVGVAILDHAGAPSHAISVSGPKSRMSFARLQEIGDAMRPLVRDLSARLGAPAR